ncbi:MAG: hypothetical protein RL385_3443 [Pseudomonadota bacterium]
MLYKALAGTLPWDVSGSYADRPLRARSRAAPRLGPVVIRPAIALAAGMLFGAGLAWSGMADPNRVRAFLDLFGAWDPTLAFVMAGVLILKYDFPLSQ